MADGLIDQDADRDEPGPIVVATQLVGEETQLKEGGRLAGAVADGLRDLKRPRELLPRRRVGASLRSIVASWCQVAASPARSPMA